MARNTPNVPRDAGLTALPLTPDQAAKKIIVSSTMSASSVITLQTGTTLLEVNAVNQGVFLKYGSASVTTANADEYILPNTVRHYVLPSGTSTVALKEEAATAKVIVIEK